MKTMWMKTLALSACAVMYSHAIFGIGGQWAPALGLAIKGSDQNIAASGSDSISVKQASASGLNGMGLKLWIDALPFIDIEASSNFQYTLYDVSVNGPGSQTTPIKFDLPVPILDKPGFARIMSDVTLLYPFLKLPPVVNLVKVYAGAGITHVLATEVINADFAKKAVAKATANNNDAAADTPEEVAAILAKSIKDEGLNSGIGFHLELGAKIKPPVIPLAAFVDFKYHFLSSMPSAVDGNSLTMEIGGALAF